MYIPAVLMNRPIRKRQAMLFRRMRDIFIEELASTNDEHCRLEKINMRKKLKKYRRQIWDVSSSKI